MENLTARLHAYLNFEHYNNKNMKWDDRNPPLVHDQHNDSHVILQQIVFSNQLMLNDNHSRNKVPVPTMHNTSSCWFFLETTNHSEKEP